MADAWRVPDDLLRHQGEHPEAADWFESVPLLAVELAGEWRLRPDGAAMSGFMSVVWPVCDAHDRALVLKLHGPWVGASGEIPFLRSATGPSVVELVEYDSARGALLLERLHSTRTLAQSS